jgi:tryptophan synthase beta chain
VIEIARECSARRERKTIVFSYSGHGLLDLGAYGRLIGGELESSADELPQTLSAANA